MKSCNRVILSVLLLLVPGCDVASTASAEQSISCTAGCSVAPTPPAGAPASSSVTWSTTSSGGISWAGDNWNVTLPFVKGDQFTTVTASGVQDTSGCNVIVTLQSSVGGPLGNNASSGSGASGQSVAVTLSTPHVVQDSETVWVQLTPLCGGAVPHVNTAQSAVGALAVSAPGPRPAVLIQHTRFDHVVPASAVLVSGTQPMVNWPRLFIAPSSEFFYPIGGVDASWTITGVRLYMTQMPLGNPSYELATDNIGTFGDNGFTPILGTIVTTSAMVVDMPIPSALSVSGPLHVHIRTDSLSTSSLGAVEFHYSAPVTSN